MLNILQDSDANTANAEVDCIFSSEQSKVKNVFGIGDVLCIICMTWRAIKLEGSDRL